MSSSPASPSPSSLSFAVTTRNGVQHRLDPLTGAAVRINPARASRPKMGADSSDTSLQTLIKRAEERDPFAPTVIFSKVPKFADEVLEHVPKEQQHEGRIVRGDTVFFPNLNPFGDNHGVGVFCKESYLAMAQFTQTMLVDCLLSSQDFIRAASKSSGAQFPVLMWNYMPPSAGSIVHPHVQVLVEDAALPNMVQQLQQFSDYKQRTTQNGFSDLVATEKAAGVRYIGSNASVDVVASFAPRGFSEVHFIMKGISHILAMTPVHVDHFVDALLRVLKGYEELGVGSFNMVSFSGALDGRSDSSYSLNFKLFSRPFPQGLYTNDTGPTERMYDTWVIDTIPEVVAETLKKFF